MDSYFLHSWHSKKKSYKFDHNFSASIKLQEEEVANSEENHKTVIVTFIVLFIIFH